MALIGRLFVIAFAIIVATMAAFTVYGIGIFGLAPVSIAEDPAAGVLVWGMTLFAASVWTAAGVLPLLIAIMVAEAFAIRSFLVHAAAGAAMMAIGAYGAGLNNSYEESIDSAPRAVSREVELAAAAGAVFGVVYWMIAGRRAGAWRRRV